jgi:hypothetical protein
MFSLLSSISTGELFKRQLPVFMGSFVIAEVFFKFHSFTLECGAFLATWYALDAMLHVMTGSKTHQRFPH